MELTFLQWLGIGLATWVFIMISTRYGFGPKQLIIDAVEPLAVATILLWPLALIAYVFVAICVLIEKFAKWATRS